MRCAEGPDHVNAPGFQVCPGEHDDRRKVRQFGLAQRRDLVLAAGVVPADPAAPPVGQAPSEAGRVDAQQLVIAECRRVRPAQRRRATVPVEPVVMRRLS